METKNNDNKLWYDKCLSIKAFIIVMIIIFAINAGLFQEPISAFKKTLLEFLQEGKKNN
jgi:hypothetical protein